MIVTRQNVPCLRYSTVKNPLMVYPTKTLQCKVFDYLYSLIELNNREGDNNINHSLVKESIKVRRISTDKTLRFCHWYVAICQINGF